MHTIKINLVRGCSYEKFSIIILAQNFHIISDSYNLKGLYKIFSSHLVRRPPGLAVP